MLLGQTACDFLPLISPSSKRTRSGVTARRVLFCFKLINVNDNVNDNDNDVSLPVRATNRSNQR